MSDSKIRARNPILALALAGLFAWTAPQASAATDLDVAIANSRARLNYLQVSIQYNSGLVRFQKGQVRLYLEQARFWRAAGFPNLAAPWEVRAAQAAVQAFATEQQVIVLQGRANHELQVLLQLLARRNASYRRGPGL